MLCRKCNGSGNIVLRKEYTFCDSCFLSYIDHKFRACLGKNLKLTAEKVLVCVSGGKCSATLLDLVHNGISLDSHKKLRIVPYFLHITGIDKWSSDEKLIASVVEQCKKYDYHVIVVNINHNFSPNEISNLNLEASQTKNWRVSSTTNYDLLTQLKENLYVRVAKELNCKYVFTGESTSTLSLNLLSNIAIGRGSQIENNIGFCNRKDENVHILRPMRDITKEEIDNYVCLKTLGPIFNEDIRNSLQSVIEDFVSDLQENFPATLSTICKTADKMSSVSNQIQCKKCFLCKNDIFNDSDKLTAAEATVFSSMVSSRKYAVNDIIPKLKDLQLSADNLCYCCSKNISELNKCCEELDLQQMLISNKDEI